VSARVEILDHGYIELIEAWGSDERIIEAARMSTQKGFDGWGPKSCPACSPVSMVGGGSRSFGNGCDKCVEGRVPGDEKLLAYLWKNHHATPFEMAGAIFEVQAPIFVFREWHRHRTQSFNEASARYAPLPDLNYIPTGDRLLANAGANKQAGGTGKALDESGAMIFIDDLRTAYELAERAYQNALGEGVPKELARLVLPVGRYSKMRASANLRNWLAFLMLRDHPAAQWEIRQYASAVCVALAEKFPRTLALFQEDRTA